MIDLFENPLVVAKHAAEREVRDAFQARYGSFWKCPKCGGMRVRHSATRGLEAMCWDCAVRAVTAGYAPPPVETIDAAAILIDGKVWSVSPPGRHHSVICLYVFGSPVHPPDKSAIDAPLREFTGKNGVQGFLTSTGRFVDRVEGKRIAVAAGQYRNPDSAEVRNRIGPSPVSNELYSEDVW